MKRFTVRILIGLLTALLLLSSLPAAVMAEEPTAGASGRVLHVSPDGSDEAPGTEEQPLRSLYKAMMAMEPGDTLMVRGGTYDGTGSSGIINKQGSPDRMFTVLPYPGEIPVIDGKGGTGFGLYFVNSSYWRVEGFEIKSYQETGVFLGTDSHHLEFYGLKIHDIADLTDTGTSFGRSGITSYADDILVDSCEMYDIGYSRGLGDMHDHGIYISNKGSNWVIRNNYFHDIYNGGGVQIYGGNGEKAHSLIENNLFVRTRMGMILGGEQCYDNEVRNNVFWHNTKCDVFPTEGAHDNNIHHNVFGPMMPDACEILGRHIDIPQLSCLENTFDCNFYDNSADNGGEQLARIQNWGSSGNDFEQQISWEIWCAPRDASEDVTAFGGTENRISGLGQEAHGQIGTVRFQNAPGGNFALREDSEPAVKDVGLKEFKWMPTERLTSWETLPEASPEVTAVLRVLHGSRFLAQNARKNEMKILWNMKEGYLDALRARQKQLLDAFEAAEFSDDELDLIRQEAQFTLADISNLDCYYGEGISRRDAVVREGTDQLETAADLPAMAAILDEACSELIPLPNLIQYQKELARELQNQVDRNDYEKEIWQQVSPLRNSGRTAILAAETVEEADAAMKEALTAIAAFPKKEAEPSSEASQPETEPTSSTADAPAGDHKIPFPTVPVIAVGAVLLIVVVVIVSRSKKNRG